MTHSPEFSTLVRAYDLGGFGDIAGAMRVASYFQRTGIHTCLDPKSESARKKLTILSPDVAQNGLISETKGPVVQVDIAGHYRDSRNHSNGDVPHHFTEDMDNPQSRRMVVPIYLKTGLTARNTK